MARGGVFRGPFPPDEERREGNRSARGDPEEPRNAVLYIDKKLEQHNLIQAIARVDRLHEQKKYGLLIDYRGILKALDTALTEYQDLAERTQGGFDLNDIDELYTAVSTEYKRLPNLHAAIWTISRPVKHRADIEPYRQQPGPETCDTEAATT